MTPKDVMKMVKEKGAKFADFKFMDYPGMWQHFTVPIQQLEESSFEEGFGFDGSSIRGWQAIHASDMLIIPDAATAVMDPFTAVPESPGACGTRRTPAGTCVHAAGRPHVGNDARRRRCFRMGRTTTRSAGLGEVVAWGRNVDFECDVPPPPAGLSYVEVAAGLAETLAPHRADEHLRHLRRRLRRQPACQPAFGGAVFHQQALVHPAAGKGSGP